MQSGVMVQFFLKVAVILTDTGNSGGSLISCLSQAQCMPMFPTCPCGSGWRKPMVAPAPRDTPASARGKRLKWKLFSIIFSPLFVQCF